MGVFELLALSIALSVATAAAAWTGGRLVEGRSADPRLRDRMWATALVLPALPLLAVGLMLLIPAPVREVAARPPTLMDAPMFETVAASAAGTVEPVLTLDPRILAVTILVLAGLLTLARSGRLAFRAWRLARLVRTLDRPDPATLRMVETAAISLEVRTPCVGVSEGTSGPLLSGFVRPRLILPAALSAAADPEVARAVVAHELVHLKRGDHRALWLEEALLTLLAINPLMPVLRAKRAAAREEVCDALALAGAGPGTRRAYAETLIEAWRSRAGPQGLPALTFTGAGRRTAMHRLKAVMNPAPPAGRRPRLLAAGAALAVAAAAGVGSLAVAGEREAVVLVRPGPAEAPVAPAEEPRVVDTPAGARQETTGRTAAEAAFSRLTPEQQARYRDPTGEQYRALCASSDPADGGFCAGVIFAQFPRDGGGGRDDICLPPELEEGDEAARRAALGTLVERTRAEIARAAARPGDRPAEVARAALARAYSCDASALRARTRLSGR